MSLDTRTKNQLLKHLENDNLNSMYFKKTLKYIEEKKINFEEAFGFIIEATHSLKGFPLYLIYSKKIKNPSYLYNGISLPIYFDMYNRNLPKNLLVEIGGEYKLENMDLNYLTNILLKVKDLNVIKSILTMNKAILFEPIKIILTGHTYSNEFSNYLYMLLYCLWESKDEIKTKDLEKLINFVLFELNLSISEIERLVYMSDENTHIGNAPITFLIFNSPLTLVKRFIDTYGFDYELSVPDNYSYSYIPIIPAILCHYFSYYNDNNYIKRFKDILNIFINLKIPFMPKEILAQTKSSDISMSKMFNNEPSIGVKARSYKETIQQFQKRLNKKDNQFYDKNFELIEYYINHTNTLIDDNDFWNEALIADDILYPKILAKNKEITKVFTYENIKSIVKNAIYMNKPHLIKELFENDKNNIKHFHVQNLSGKTIVFEILSYSTSGINPAELIEFFKLLLSYGYRVNNHIGQKSFFEFLPFNNKELNIKDTLIELTKLYPNYETMITFNLDKIDDTQESNFYLKKFLHIEIFCKDLVRVLNEFKINIQDVCFVECKVDMMYFYSIKSKQYVIFNKSIVGGNPLKLSDFEIIGA